MNPAVTEIDICNLALRKVGAQTVMSFDEQSENARLCKIFYPRVRDIVLRMYRWNCATRRASLVKLAAAPAFGYSSQFALPPDCLFVQRLDDQNVDYKIEGRLLLANASRCNLIYTARVEDPTQFDQLLVQCIYTYLAAEISTSLRQDAQMYQALMNEVNTRILPAARALDSQENSMQVIEANSFLNSRRQTESFY
jgi:hypothetical protein